MYKTLLNTLRAINFECEFPILPPRGAKTSRFNNNPRGPTGGYKNTEAGQNSNRGDQGEDKFVNRNGGYKNTGYANENVQSSGMPYNSKPQFNDQFEDDHYEPSNVPQGGYRKNQYDVGRDKPKYTSRVSVGRGKYNNSNARQQEDY